MKHYFLRAGLSIAAFVLMASTVVAQTASPSSAGSSIPLSSTAIRAGHAAAATGVAQPLIIVNALDGVLIDHHLFGSDNLWPYVSDSSFDAFAGSLKSNCGVTLIRYPGGFESEHYKWSDNTLESDYRKYTATPGVTPEHVLGVMGVGNVTFVVRTQDALEANTPEAYKLWAGRAAELVAMYGDRVRDWEIGNEWYNVGGAHKHYDDFLHRYATLLTYFAPAMKEAAARKGYHVRLYVTDNWTKPEDVAVMRAATGPSAWSAVDGLNIHVYTGMAPSKDRPFPPPAVSDVESVIRAIKKDSGKDLIYSSEWMADLEDNNHSGGLRDANTMMSIIGGMARAGVSEAAYWPPVWPTKATGKPAPQEDTVTLVHNNAAYSVDADGQAMKWLSTSYEGTALSVVTVNTAVKSIAAKDGEQVTVFVIGGQVSNETERIQVDGFAWNKIVSAQVMYATDANLGSGPASIADISASKEEVAGHSIAKVAINPSGPQRGSSWEIIKLVLQ